MEAIPLPDAGVDLIISNGVINLSARKARVMAVRGCSDPAAGCASPT